MRVRLRELVISGVSDVSGFDSVADPLSTVGAHEADSEAQTTPMIARFMPLSAAMDVPRAVKDA